MDRLMTEQDKDGGADSDSHGVSGSPRPRRFMDVWKVASTYDGWLTTEQARSLWDRASGLCQGANVVEIGSHQGRSTVVLAGAVEQLGGLVTAIDPFDDPRWGGGQESRDVFLANVGALDLMDSSTIIQGLSTSERRRWMTPIQLLYIDGAHDFSTVCDDLKWSECVVPKGLVAVHDGFSSIGVTAALLYRVLGSKNLRYAERIGSLVWFVKEPPTIKTRLLLGFQTLWFVRNLAVKVALRRDWSWLLKLLMHSGGEYPY